MYLGDVKMLESYCKYLEFLDTKLVGFFNSQKPFIFCQKGCAKCCKHAEFPYSVTEMRYLFEGIEKLDIETQEKIEENLKKIIEAKQKYKGKKFLYDCPLLIDNICSVYDYRGVICRSFGLMTNYENEKFRAPFCAFEGLNYSNVLNLRKHTISTRKYKKLKVQEEPLGFNVSYKFLTDEAFEKKFNFVFGEKRPMIEWFV